MEVRPFQIEDQGAVIGLWRACGLTVPWNDPASDIRRCMDGPSSTLLIGLVDRAIVATAMVGHDGHRGWIYYVAVDPGRQRGGFGRAMMSTAEAWLRARDIPKVQLMIREDNTAVADFYSRLGYEETPRVLMAKWLEK